MVGACAAHEQHLAAGATSFDGSVAHPSEPGVAHRIRFSVDAHLGITGTGSWPANPARGLSARSFALRGKSATNGRYGRFEFVDDAPERLPGFRRGIYVGSLSPAGGRISGQYYEIDEQTHGLFYWGDWTATCQTAASPP